MGEVKGRRDINVELSKFKVKFWNGVLLTSAGKLHSEKIEERSAGLISMLTFDLQNPSGQLTSGRVDTDYQRQSTRPVGPS